MKNSRRKRGTERNRYSLCFTIGKVTPRGSLWETQNDPSGVIAMIPEGSFQGHVKHGG